MKRAQVSIIYLGIVSLISIALLGLIFIWFDSLKDNVAIEFNEQHAENLLTYFEQKLVSMKTVAYTASGSNSDSTIYVSVPYKVGDEGFFVKGDGNDLVLQIAGKGTIQNRQTIFRKKIYWWNVTFSGGAYSGNGEVVFYYNSTSQNVTIS